MGALKSEIVKVYPGDITVYGCFEEGFTPKGEYDHYDVFCGDLGECFEKCPTLSQINEMLDRS